MTDIRHLIQASQRLGSLIDDLLSLSRVGRIIHAPKVFDPADVVKTVCTDLADLIQRRAPWSTSRATSPRSPAIGSGSINC